MKKLFTLFLLMLLPVIAMAEGDGVRLSNDTLYCSLSSDEVGTLKNKTSDISDLNTIKTLILEGYISQADEDFIHTLGKNYNLQNLDMTELHSSMSYQGLQGCSKIKSTKYSKYWSSTGQCLFEDCINLNEVVFPNSDESNLVTFSSGTFRGCTSLTTITIPKGVKMMDSQVFYLCDNLKEIHCESGIAPSSKQDTFGGQFPTAIVYVPQGAIINYKTSAGWCLFENFSEDPNMIYEDDPNLVSNNIYVTNDTLFCNLTDSEIGYLRMSVLATTTDLNSIKHVVLNGYLNRNDGDFLNALSSAYSLSSLDMSNLKSTLTNYQFQACTKLTKIKYSRYWSSTGWYLFEDCSNLTEIIFPENSIGSGYTSFETGTFRGCSSLEEINIPATVNSIGNQCFYLCNGLKTIFLKPTTPPAAKESCFGGQFTTAKLVVPKGTKTDYETSSGWSLFSIIEENSEDVNIDEKDISDNISFSDGILYVNLTAEETGRLKSSVLYKYPDLSQIHSAVVSNYVNADDASFLNALASSYNLQLIDFTELKSSFGNYAFQGCSNLIEVNYSRYWSSTGWYLFEDCSSLVNIKFPVNPVDKGITLFETGSFRGCSALKEIVIPENVTHIGSQCFYLCHNLKTVNFLGSSIKSIDKGAFESCNSLETIILPNSLTLIGERCFEGCPKIKEVHCESITPPDISATSFDDVYENATLYVPIGCRDKYASAPVWKNFSNIRESQTSDVEIVAPDGSVVETEIYIEVLDENSKTAIIKTANIPASENGSGKIAIPAVVNGYTITSIDDNAFKGMTDITDIYLPETDQPLILGENALKIDDEHVATVHVPVGLLGAYALNDQLTQNFAEGKVKATVTAPARYWTFSAGVDVIVPEGVGVYICKFESTDKVTITELEDNQLLNNGKRIIKANNGVLVACNNGTGGNAYDIVANPGGQTTMAPASYDAKSYGDENMLEPVLVSKNYPASNYYVLKNGEFHKILANSSKMPAGKAVLRLPGIDNGARILSIIGDPNDGTTGIRNHNAIEAESKWFDMQGRRIERPSKPGLYINNGKKVVIK